VFILFQFQTIQYYTPGVSLAQPGKWGYVSKIVQKHRKFLVILLVFIAGTLACQTVLPIVEGPDEVLHYNYVLWLRLNHRLPDRTTFRTNMTLQETGQPPLTYAAAAFVLDLFRVPIVNTDLLPGLRNVRNHWFSPPDPWNWLDNANQYYHGPGESTFGNPDVVLADHIARLISLAYGVLAVLGAYGIAREFFEQERWVLTATAFFAFSPVIMYMGATLSNDVSATAFATLAIWRTLVLLRRGATPVGLITIGLLIGLAGLSKVSALTIVPGVALAIGLASKTWARRLRDLVLCGLAALLIFGPWVAYGAITFGDPLGLRTHEATRAITLPTVLEVMGKLPDLYMSYWAKYGSASIWLHPVVYVLLTGILVLSALGYGQALLAKRLTMSRLARLRLYVSMTMILLAAGALVYWLVSLFPVAFAITGRLIYFAHGPVSIAVVGGLHFLARDRAPRWDAIIRGTPISLLMGVSLIIGPFTVWSAFAPPALLTRAELPPTTWTPTDYDGTIRFLGYGDTESTIRAGSLYSIVLCWQVLAPTHRDGAFAIKLFDGAGHQIGGRTSVHGLGHFDSSQWRTGDIFCDRVDVPIDRSVKPGEHYSMLLMIQDVEGSQAEWPMTVDGVRIPYLTLMTVTVAP